MDKLDKFEGVKKQLPTGTTVFTSPIRVSQDLLPCR
jgi:hypothetical protein